MTHPDSTGSWYVRDRGRTEGPYSLDALRRLIQTKRLARHHQVSTDGVTWDRAVVALPPEVFGVKALAASPPPPPETIGGLNSSATPGGDPVPEPPPVEPTSSSPMIQWAQLGPIVLGLATLGAIAAVGSLIVFTILPTRQSDDDLRARLGPSLVALQGLHPTKGKIQCYGLLVSRQHIVAPIVAASLKAPKTQIEHKDGKNIWHSTYLLMADPHTNLCVLRADAGSDVTFLTPPSDAHLPSDKESLRLMKPGKEDRRAVEWGTLSRFINEDGPDEMMIVEFDYDADAADAPLGRTVVNTKGTLVGMVVGRAPDGDAICVPAREIRAKRKDASALPADHVMDPITPPEDRVSPGPPVVKDTSSPSAEESFENAQQRKPGDAGPDENVPEHPGGPSGDSSPPAAKSGPRNERTDGERVRSESPSDVITDVTKSTVRMIDDALPELPPEKARELGRTHLQAVLKEHHACKDRSLTKRVHRLADDVIRAAGRTPSDVTLTVVEDEENNAYAFVGNNIVINTGFLSYAGTDDDMILFVLAHELGHIIDGHVDLPFRRMMVTEGLAGLNAVADEAIVTVLKNSPYNQAQEEDADCFAVKLLGRMSKSTAGGVRFFRKRAGDGATGKGRDELTVPDLFSSHPDDERRIELLTGGCDSP